MKRFIGFMLLAGLLPLFNVSTGSAREVGWRWINPSPTGADLTAISGINPNSAFAVGQNGTALRWQGRQWDPIGPGGTLDFTAVWELNHDSAIAVGELGRAFIWNGQSWHEMNTGTTSDLTAIWGAAEDAAYCVSADGAILHWDGQVWSQVFQGPEFSDITGRASDDVTALAVTGSLVHWDGTEWRVMSASLPQGTMDALWVSSAGETFATWNFFRYGKVYHWNGTGWDELWNGLYNLRSLQGTGDGHLFAAGDSNAVYHWDGSAWSWIGLPEAIRISGLWAVSNESIYVVGYAGSIWHWDGENWADVTRFTSHSLTDIAGVGPDDMMLTSEMWGETGDVLRWDGSHWRWMNTNVGLPLESITRFPGGEAIACGWEGGTLIHWDGTSWTDRTFDTLTGYSGVWGAALDTAWAAGAVTPENSVISQWNGAEWAHVPGSMDFPVLFDIWGSAADLIFACGRSGAVIRWDGTAWQAMETPSSQHLTALWGRGRQLALAVGGGGAIIAWDGTTWEAMASGTEDNLHGVFGVAANDVYAVGDNGCILHYDGAAWTKLPPVTAVDLLSVWASGPEDVYAVGEAGIILHYGPIPTPTPSPVPTHSATPTAEPTVPSPSPAPTRPPDQTGAYLSANATDIGAGERLRIQVNARNAGQTTLRCCLFTLLDLGTDEYWFWPGWKHYPDDVDFTAVELPAAGASVHDVLNFVWPADGSAVVCQFLAALTDEAITELIGDVDLLEITFHP